VSLTQFDDVVGYEGVQEMQVEWGKLVEIMAVLEEVFLHPHTSQRKMEE
jgi:hypothetical protein